LACALMKTAAKGDTTHELQNTANGTDVECKLLRRGFVSLRITDLELNRWHRHGVSIGEYCR